MIVFTNEFHEIIDINATTNPDLTPVELSDETFIGKCKAFICGYKAGWEGCEQPDGSTTQCFTVYPFKDIVLLEAIQQEYEVEQANNNELLETIVDNDYRLSMLELGIN